MNKSKKTKRTNVVQKVETNPEARMKTLSALEECSAIMQSLGEQEVDFTDENSSFIQLAKMNRSYKKFVMKYGSGKDKEDIGIKRRNIRVPSKYPAELIKAVENFINSKKFRTTWNQPDRNDIYDIVESQKDSLTSRMSVDSVAESIFKFIHRKIKSLREKKLVDLHQTELDQIGSEVAPADLDKKLLPKGEMDKRVYDYVEDYKRKVVDQEDFSATSGEESNDEYMETEILSAGQDNELKDPLLRIPPILNPDVEEIIID